MTAYNRRHFLYQTGIGLSSALFAGPAIVRGQNLNSKIQLACIGVGGKGSSDVTENAATGMQVVGLCDVDANHLKNMALKFPDARTFKDFRQMLTSLGDGIDAVTVSTPDHVHGAASIMAMNMGKHIYCQKPLTQTVWESRMMRNLAKEKKLATQMGNQGSAMPGLRRAVELVHAGVIGKPLELHVWSNRPIWPQGMDRPAGEDPVPAHLDWDLWLGPAAHRPFKEKIYHDFAWRGWTEFGTGALGDMACHGVNMPFRALKLGYPTRIECEMASRTYAESYPLTSRVRFEFPEREGWPAMKFWWYDGAPGGAIAPLRPHPDLCFELLATFGKLPNSGCLIIGEKGKLFAPDDYGSKSLLAMNEEKTFTDSDVHEAAKQVEKTIPRSPGHQQEWFDMIQGGSPAYSNFDIAAYLNEIILLGSIAQRLGEGNVIDWDGPNMKSTNIEAATAMVKRNYRDGWEPKIG